MLPEAALLALLGDLYAQIIAMRERIAELEKPRES